MISLKVLLIAAAVIGASVCEIPQEEDYGPIRRPSNPSSARDILGYDHFQTSNRAGPNKIQFGNHWEQFDSSPPIKYEPNRVQYDRPPFFK